MKVLEMLLLCLETRHCRLVRVDDSTIFDLMTLDVAGALSSWALDSSGVQIN
jgi:hypothetical protein